ncbi:MAG: hypothetical protein HY329_20755 [Chloroflexi bacterium]|nr:hypothetical protein [Chloroflexota bacterium]
MILPQSWFILALLVYCTPSGGLLARSAPVPPNVSSFTTEPPAALVPASSLSLHVVSIVASPDTQPGATR